MRGVVASSVVVVVVVVVVGVAVLAVVASVAAAAAGRRVARRAAWLCDAIDVAGRSLGNVARKGGVLWCQNAATRLRCGGATAHATRVRARAREWHGAAQLERHGRVGRFAHERGKLLRACRAHRKEERERVHVALSRRSGLARHERLCVEHGAHARLAHSAKVASERAINEEPRVAARRKLEARLGALELGVRGAREWIVGAVRVAKGVKRIALQSETAIRRELKLEIDIVARRERSVAEPEIKGAPR